ncbi:TonB-dependent receptor [Novosphingobium sp. PS1R-30]|uniref:TonB-dependent receptor n=1 Tax=Novosphingobium anseongense TaxID=3133436 RepID=A0ABU8S2Q5_9SPHN
MNSTTKFSLLLASALPALMATPSYAQNAETDASEDGAIIVTARRVEERLQDVPISITVFSQQQLDNRNITTASDLGTYTPSLTSNSRFGPDKSSFTIRGFNQDSNTSPTVGVYFADVVAPRAAAGTPSGNGAGPGSFFDLQNIQVLKGPQGTLFGRNTTGGAILLVPKKPTADFEGYVEGSVGNYDLIRGQAVINIPLADTFRVRLGVDRQKRDGYLHNRSGVGPDRYADSNYLALRLSVVGELTPDLENYTIATYTRSNTNGFSYKLASCQRNPALRTGRAALTAPLACTQIDRQAARGDGYYDIESPAPDPLNFLEQWQVINTTTWRVNDALTVKNIASYSEFRERVRYSIGGEFFIPATGPSAGRGVSATILNNAPNQETAAQSTFTNELQLQGQHGNLTWQTGAYYEQSEPLSTGNTSYSQSFIECSDVFTLQCVNSIPGLSGVSLVYNKVAFRNIGFYGQGTYKFSDKFAVTAGLRYTIDRTTGSGRRIQVTFPTANTPRGVCANPALPVGAPGSVTLEPARCELGGFVQESKRPTWLIDAEYKPSEDILLYAKYTRGYRQGGLNPSIIGLETWNPEKVDTYELGAKTSFNGRDFSGFVNLAGFYNNFTDQQLTTTAVGRVPGIAGTQVVINAGKSRLWGIEADGSMTPFRSLQLDVGYAYLNTKLQEFVLPPLPANSPYSAPIPLTVGNDLPLSPHHRITGTLTYTLPLDESIGRLSIGATYTYTSRQIASDSSPLGLLPKQELVNLNLNWASVAGLPLDASFFVTNLTKEKFYLNVTNNFASGGYEAIAPNQPRMYGIRLRYRFGM